LTGISFFAGVNLLEPVITLFYFAHGLTETQVFWILLCFSMSVFVFEVPTGMVADRFGARVSFFVGVMVRIASLLCLWLADGVWWIALAQVLSGMAATFFSGAEETLLYESLKADGREGENGAISGKLQAIRLLPMIMGLIAGAIWAKDLTMEQFHGLIVINMICVGGQLLFTLRLKEPPHLWEKSDRLFGHLRAGWKAVTGAPSLLLLFTNVTIIFITTYVFTTFEQEWLRKLHLPVETFGLVFAAGLLMAAGASRATGWLMKRRSPVFWMQATGIAIFLSYALAVCFPNSLTVAVGASILVRVARSVRNPITIHLYNEYLPSGSRATALSLLSVLDSVFDLILIVSLASIAAWGIYAIYMGLAALALVGLLFPVRRKGEGLTPQQRHSQTG